MARPNVTKVVDTKGFEPRRSTVLKGESAVFQVPVMLRARSDKRRGVIDRSFLTLFSEL